MQDILDTIDHRFGVQWSHEQRPDLWQVRVARDHTVPALQWLRDYTDFIQLTHLTVVDWIEDGEFELVYLMTDPKAHRSLMVMSRISRDEAEAESVHTLWPIARTYEQEINEFFGIHFPGSPRQGVPFALDDGWDQLPPMRRDFDTKAYVEENMSVRPGRETISPKQRVSESSGQKGYLHDN